ncbi:permease [Syntrophus aciditrophicus]|uniref:Predicted permease n=1 Tax=Syntrophus aciditrophicus (strain SB) TaxID=56780 RepID=Q2LXK4_SYNAS|nr:permease [Syntrophus aciditrophicus]ABC78811.1 predicted permease [Syntrophus aciditrophicus SB]
MLGLNNFVVAGKFFLVIAGELILIFIAVSFIIGLLMEYLPPSRIRDFLSNRLSWVQYLLGSGLGAVTPFCSCSTVPITAGLLRGGVPFGPTMAFLFASPVLNPIIIALLLSLFGYQVTGIYVVVTYLGSMATAALLSKLGLEGEVKPLVNFQSSCCPEEKKSEATPLKILPMASGCCSSEGTQPSVQPLPLVTLPSFQSQGSCCCGETVATVQNSSSSSCCSVSFEAGESAKAPLKEKIKRAAASAVDTFKGVFWYLLLGAGIGAFIYGFFPQDLVVRLAGPGNPWSIPIAAFIGVPMYIRAETVIPISAALVGKGMGVGTVLALVIGGAGASIPELIILSAMFRKKLIIAFALNVFLIAVVAGYLVDIFIY